FNRLGRQPIGMRELMRTRQPVLDGIDPHRQRRQLGPVLVEPAPLITPPQPARRDLGAASSQDTSRAHPDDNPRSSAAIPSSVTIRRRSSSDTGRWPVSIWLRCC
ncbi:MAG: hypothetical protein ACRDTF_10725, partial [Pseudonocardiaceae bacterium]